MNKTIFIDPHSRKQKQLLKASGTILEPSWPILRPFWRRLGPFRCILEPSRMDRPDAILAHLRTRWVAMEGATSAISESSGLQYCFNISGLRLIPCRLLPSRCILEPSWEHLELSSYLVGASWDFLATSRSHFKPSWGLLGTRHVPELNF